MALGSDGQLKRLAKEETILTGGKVSQRHTKAHDRPILRAGQREGQ